LIEPSDYDVIISGRSRILYKAEKMDPGLPDPSRNKELMDRLKSIPGLKPKRHQNGKLFIKQPVNADNSIEAKNRFSRINDAFWICRYRLYQVN
jgi:hypothetical protein